MNYNKHIVIIIQFYFSLVPQLPMQVCFIYFLLSSYTGENNNFYNPV